MNQSPLLCETSKILVAFLLIMGSVIPIFAQAQLSSEQSTALAEASKLSREVVRLHKSKDYDQAIKLAEQALALRLKALGPDSNLVGDSYTNLAVIHLENKDFDKSEEYYRRAAACYEKSDNPKQLVAVLEVLTMFRSRVSDHSKAVVYAERVVRLKERLFGAESPQLAEALNTLGKNYVAWEKNADAMATYLKIVVMIENHTPLLSNKILQDLLVYKCALKQKKQSAEVSSFISRVDKMPMWSEDVKQPKDPLFVGTLNGRALSLPRPPYPMHPLGPKVYGVVMVRVLIDECGFVVEAEAIEGPNELRGASIAAAKEAKFSPTLAKGSPVKVSGVISYNFVRQ